MPIGKLTLMKSDKMNRYGYMLLVFILICAYFFSLHIVPINGDYGYYVGAAKSIAHGMVPYRDVVLWYPPFVFYILSIPYALFGIDISPMTPMYVAFLFNLANGYLIWRIMKFWQVESTIRKFSLVLYIIYLFSVESVFLGLEPFAIFWGLLGTYALLKRGRYSEIAAGICLTMAFLCKQYALLYAPIYVLLILLLRPEVNVKKRLYAVMQVAFYSLLSVLIVHVIFIGLTGQKDYFMPLLGSGYGSRTIDGIVGVMKKRFLHMFFVILLLPFIWSRVTQIEKRKISFFVLAILLLLLQNYFDTSPHYLMFIVPYVILLIAIIIQNIVISKIRFIFCIIVLSSAVYFSVLATKSYSIFKMDEENHRELTRSMQLEVARFLQEVVPPKSRTVVARQWNALVTPHLYGIVDIVPVDFQNTRFGFEDDEQLINQLKDSEVLIIEKSHPLYDDFLRQFGSPSSSYRYEDVEVLLK